MIFFLPGFPSHIIAFGFLIIFNYRLNFGLVTAVFGLKRGILDVTLFKVIFLCILLSSIGAPFLEKKFLGVRAISFLHPDFEENEGVPGRKGAFPSPWHAESKRE